MQNTKPRLVVVDDEPGMRDFIAEVAEMAGFDAIAVGDASALAAALTPEPDVVVIDLMMPGFDGVEVVRELARRRCAARLILASGLDRQVLESAARLAAAHGLQVVSTLSKPIRAAVLRTILLGLKEQQAPAQARRAPVYKAEAGELRRAIEQDQLIVHFQPQLCLSDARWVGIEALVRWRHPERGLLYPDAFIEAAESSDLALPLTYKVLELALRHRAEVARETGFDGTVSVNVPAIALHDFTFPEAVLARLGGFSGSKLMLEVTETSVSAELVSALDILTRLRMRGIGLSIDDFGTGQSGLERLHQLPFTELKIDMSFVQAAERDAAARVIVENSIALGRSLNMTVVAEGVENDSAWQWLRSRGCDVAQGYYIRRPGTPAELGEWRRTWRPAG